MKRTLTLLTTLLLAPLAYAVVDSQTCVSIADGRWHLNNRVTYPGTKAEGLLMNVRMVNAVFEDRQKPDFDTAANTDRFIAQIPHYAAHGVRAFTICLQGGMPGYEGAVNSAFNPDGSLREPYLQRVQRVIEACDRHGVVVILGCYYQRQSKILKDEAAVRAGVVNVVKWIQARGFQNVAIEIANEYPHKGFVHPVIRDPKGMASLIRLAKQTAPGLLVSASGYGDGLVHKEVAEAADFLLPHWNGTKVEQIPARLAELKRFGKPIVCNEDDKTGAEAVAAMQASIANGAGYGLMLKKHNQTFPFHFDGAADDPLYYAALKAATSRNVAPLYPPSPVIERVEFDFSTHKRLAPGSDNWPTTWADDGHLYTAWGDGGGFGGDNKKGRVTLGVARVEGDAGNYTGKNVWGGFEPEQPATFGGKSYGILSIAGTLYMWVVPQPGPHLKECRLASSADHGATWKLADWAFRFEDGLTIPTFLNFGRDYAGARDGFVYSYFIEPTWGQATPKDSQYGFDVHKPGRIHLSRVPQEKLMERAAHEFFAGLDAGGNPRWSPRIADKQPVFADANGVGWNLSVSHNAGLRRYLLATEHGETHAGKFGLFDAPEPWGPWTTVAYEDRWGEGHVEVSAFYWNFPTKWLNADGTRFTLVFTGKNSNDSWNTIDGRFIRRAADYFPPPDSEGGWRKRVNDAKFDAAFEFAKRTTKNGGLLVLHRGWLVYERYFGRAHHEANPVNASIGKSFTSIAVGILLRERADLFPDGLDQKVFTPRYFPAEMFPLSDARKANIKLGQLLSMTAGIRGNNPGSMVNHQPATLDPAGPDGQVASTDAMAFGQIDGKFNARTLWCEPGGGYSYATASIHLGSVMVRHVTDRELEDYVEEKIARPLGWGRWDWRDPGNPHTPGGGNIAPRPTDLLRFGYLLLREGRWCDRQLVPADYVRHCARPSPYNPHYDYSLQFDVNGNGYCSDVPRDAFWKSGSGGHVLYVVPSLDLVVYKMGGRDSQYARSRPAPTPDPSREGWKEDRTIDYDMAKHETLKLVLAALRK